MAAHAAARRGGKGRGRALRRRGRYAEAFSLFSRVMVERTAPLNLKEMAGFLSRDLIERYPEAVGDKRDGSAPSAAPR